VGAENRSRPRGNFIQLFYENRASAPEFVYNMLVVYDLLPHIDRRSVKIERDPHNVNGPYHPRAKTARLEQKDLSFHTTAIPSERLQAHVSHVTVKGSIITGGLPPVGTKPWNGNIFKVNVPGPFWNNSFMTRCIVWKAIDGLTLRLVAGNEGLREITFGEPEAGVQGSAVTNNTSDSDIHPVLRAAIEQLTAYFAGSLREFSLPLEIIGTDFQKRVWCILRDIPYGETRTYRDLAIGLGRPSAVRAVGAANGSNPLPIVIPCHRVIGVNGKLVGYGGGLALKKRLLDLERGSLW
jgi:methylated-DNA-[protein]-cysteine S-methyltransferase